MSGESKKRVIQSLPQIIYVMSYELLSSFRKAVLQDAIALTV